MNFVDRFLHKTLNKKDYVDGSNIPENEKSFYQSDDYYKTSLPVVGGGTKSVLTFEEHIEGLPATKHGLYAPQIIALYFAPKQYPNPKKGFPGYWWFKYGIRNVGKMYRELIDGGFLEIVDGECKRTSLGEKEMTDNEIFVFCHRYANKLNFGAWQAYDILRDTPERMKNWSYKDKIWNYYNQLILKGEDPIIVKYGQMNFLFIEGKWKECAKFINELIKYNDDEYGETPPGLIEMRETCQKHLRNQ